MAHSKTLWSLDSQANECISTVVLIIDAKRMIQLELVVGYHVHAQRDAFENDLEGRKQVQKYSDDRFGF